MEINITKEEIQNFIMPFSKIKLKDRVFELKRFNERRIDEIKQTTKELKLHSKDDLFLNLVQTMEQNALSLRKIELDLSVNEIKLFAEKELIKRKTKDYIIYSKKSLNKLNLIHWSVFIFAISTIIFHLLLYFYGN